MSLIDEIFTDALEHFESTAGQTFIWNSAEYCATVADETKEEDYEAEGHRLRWRVLIEATVSQFEGAYPKIRDSFSYNGRPYTVRDFSIDAHTLKITGGTTAQ